MDSIFKEYLPFWKELSAKEQGLLNEGHSIREIESGTLIHSGGDDCLGLIVVIAGRLRIFVTSEEGKEITLYRLFERDICLFSASCIMRNIDFEIMVKTEEDSKLAIISPAVYKKLSDTSLPVARYTNELMSARFSDVVWLIDQIQNKRMDSRLAALLITEHQLSGGEITLTHEQLANHLGTAREVVSRMLKYFKGEGFIEIKRGLVTIADFDALYELSADSLR